jgi:uncharacterized protein (TIGR02284 family)
LGSGTTALPIPYAKERRMTDTTNSISDLIDISEDGMAFYEEAAQKVKDKKLSTLFSRLAKAKSDFAQELSGEVKPAAGAKKKAVKKADGPLFELSKAYAGLLKQWPESSAERYSRMVEVEGQLQMTFQKVVLDRDHSFVVRVLAKQYVSKAEVLNKELRACQRAA